MENEKVGNICLRITCITKSARRLIYGCLEYNGSDFSCNRGYNYVYLHKEDGLILV